MKRTTISALMAAGLVAAAALPALGAPVCWVAPEAEVACGNRIFAEVAMSATFIQHDGPAEAQSGVAGEYELGIKALAQRFPNFVKARTLAQLMNDPTAVSVDGRDIWVIEVTDFRVAEEGKLPVVASLSVHGPERAGIEGGVRYAEDLARWATSDPGHLLRNGTDSDSIAVPVNEVLRKVHLYLSNPNPDGWAAGDLHNGGVYTRGNGNGVDLNRQFPTMGWVQTSGRPVPLNEPEAKGWAKFVEQLNPVVSADLHGEVTSVNNAFADMMYPAGQWDPAMQAREERLARHMKSNINRYFDEQNVVLGDIAGAAAGMRPADYATGYDVVGYDDSGFMGDFFTQTGAVDMDVEHFLSHQAPNSTWVVPLEQAHVAAVRGELETMVVEALVTRDVDVSFDYGSVGYLFDPAVVTDTDANGYGGPNPPAGITPEGYSATPMRYFDDLSKYTASPLRPVLSADVAGDGDNLALADLEGLDSMVIVTGAIPADAAGRPVNEGATIDALKAFVQSGGNLILTDQAIKFFLPRLTSIADSVVTKGTSNAGHVNIDAPADPYLAGVYETASQTYYEVPLGYSATGNAPHWTVTRSNFEAAGGTHLGHFSTATTRTSLGRLPVGDGTIGIIGALLPPPQETLHHFYGLADYGVTVAGGQILNNMLEAGV